MIVPLYAAPVIVVAGFAVGFLPAYRTYRRRERPTANATVMAAGQFDWLLESIDEADGAPRLAKAAETSRAYYEAHAVDPDGTRTLIATGGAEHCKTAAINYSLKHGVPCTSRWVRD